MRIVRRSLFSLLVTVTAVTLLAGCREPEASPGNPSTVPSGSLSRQEACTRAIAEAVWVPGTLTRDMIAEAINRKITLFQQLADGTKDQELLPVLVTIAKSYIQFQQDRLHEVLLVIELVEAMTDHVKALREVC